MSDIAIRVEHLSKLYRIGKAQQRHDTLREALVDGLRSSLSWLRRDGRSATGGVESTFWALKDVSFEVKRGEILGVIGRNGAGKSTLLKILSRITEPTEGRAILRGRVGSLLEVGTGFHPELTGRDNIYLSGAILGMRREEIERKFDEIVEFSGIGKFVDTPIKRYSSGMNVRLGFAVAAHLEPEILLVDEVLAVGDAEFQKKCLGKMGAVARVGRTVLFVSHNMAAIEQLCGRCLLVAQGNIGFDGSSAKAISRYLEGSHETRGPLWGLGSIEHGGVDVQFTSVVCEPTPVFMGSPFSITMGYTLGSMQAGLMFGVSIETPLGQRVIGAYTGREGLATGTVQGEQWTSIRFPVMNLIPGEYFVSVTIHEQSGENLVRLERATSFKIIGRDLTESGYLVDQRNGLVWLDHEWDLTGASSIA